MNRLSGTLVIESERALLVFPCTVCVTVPLATALEDLVIQRSDSVSALAVLSLSMSELHMRWLGMLASSRRSMHIKKVPLSYTFYSFVRVPLCLALCDAT